MPHAAGLGTFEYVFLDRDGVINRKLPEDRSVRSWDEFELLPGVEEACAALTRSGRKVIVATNQRGIALGRLSERDLGEIHRRLRAHLSRSGAVIDAVYFCPHDIGQCACRKPETGMFERALRDFPYASPANSVAVGDSLSDIEAGLRMGMKTVFIEAKSPFQKAGAVEAAKLASVVADSLWEAVFGRLLPMSPGRF